MCDLTIDIPEQSGWRLLATYKDDAFTPADPTKELILRTLRTEQTMVNVTLRSLVQECLCR